MYAHHHLDKLDNNEFLLLRGSYTNHMVRTAGGWRIARLIQHIRLARGRPRRSTGLPLSVGRSSHDGSAVPRGSW
jgi:hypothetical protein